MQSQTEPKKKGNKESLWLFQDAEMRIQEIRELSYKGGALSSSSMPKNLLMNHRSSKIHAWTRKLPHILPANQRHQPENIRGSQ